MAPLTFDSCIAPFARETFMREYLGRNVAYLPGPADRFADLVTESELAAVLSRAVVFPGSMRVKLDGHDVPPLEYLSGQLTHESTARTVNTASLERLLVAGATLFMYDSQGLFPHVSEFCDILASGFGSRVAATLIVVLAVDRPSRLHWDSHDVFVCQVAGQKRWPVFRPTMPWPLRNSFEGEIVNPSIVWEGVLTHGDALYVPRGWPHQPVAITSPSVHITFDIARPTGADLFKFVTHRLLEDARVRADLPLELPLADRRTFNSQFRTALLSAASDEAIESFYVAQQMSHGPRRFKVALSSHAGSNAARGVSS
jgi:lysine-specific demethylase/histidyl-hydroxylase NO66